MNCFKIMLTLLFLFCIVITSAQDRQQTLAPYFFIQSSHPGQELLPLKDNQIDVSIAGIIADVTVQQTYRNEGTHPIEAIYVFPASTRAAVYAMEMKIGSRIITAKIEEKNRAIKAYREAKGEGKRTSLLEQHRPNVFQMNVANILPDDEVEVTLRYTELLIPEEGVYTFVSPGVVGPRYADGGSSQDNYIVTPYLKSEEFSSFTYDIRVGIGAGLPIQSVSSTSHHIVVSHEGIDRVKIGLDESEKNPGNRDFILKYCLSGKEIQEGLLLYEGDKENFFTYLLQPPQRVRVEEIPSREYIFVVDVSGSMSGFPLRITKNLMRNLVVGLQPRDRFNVILFAGGSQVLSPDGSWAATRENVNEALAFLDDHRGGGGTRLTPALKKALSLPRCEEGLSRSVIIITDGYIRTEEETFELIRKNLSQCNVFSFGIGSSVNRFLIEGIAKVGQGEPLIVTSAEEAGQKAERFRTYISGSILAQIDLAFDGFDVYDVEPISVPDMLAERPIVVYGKYRGTPVGKIKLKGYTGTKKYKSVFDVTSVAPSQKHQALRYLWARERIRLLSDYNKLYANHDRTQAITQLGLDYNLLTAYTSFIAIDESTIASTDDPERNSQEHMLKTVRQPISMPQGVPNSAIGFDFGIQKVLRKPLKKNVAQFMELRGIEEPITKAALLKELNELLQTLTCDEKHMLKKGRFQINLQLSSNHEIIGCNASSTSEIPSPTKCLLDNLHGKVLANGALISRRNLSVTLIFS